MKTRPEFQHQAGPEGPEGNSDGWARKRKNGVGFPFTRLIGAFDSSPEPPGQSALEQSCGSVRLGNPLEEVESAARSSMARRLPLISLHGRAGADNFPSATEYWR